MDTPIKRLHGRPRKYFNEEDRKIARREQQRGRRRKARAKVNNDESGEGSVSEC